VSALARFCVILDVQNSWFAERSFFLARAAGTWFAVNVVPHPYLATSGKFSSQ